MTLLRKAPLRRKRSTVRRYKSPRCMTRGCDQPMMVICCSCERPDENGIHGWCVKHARRKADALWSAKVRKDHCELAEWHRSLGVQCGGPIVACHGFGRSYGATRWLLINGFSGCSGINNWTESHPLEWTDYLKEAWGETVYEELRQKAVGPYEVDLSAVLADLAGSIR